MSLVSPAIYCRVLRPVFCLCTLAVYVPAEAEEVVYVGSHGRVVRFDTDDPEAPFRIEAGKASKTVAGTGVTFEITFDDRVNNTGIGFDDPDRGKEFRNEVASVFQAIDSVLDETGTVDILFENSIDDSRTRLLAAAGPLFVPRPQFTNGLAFERITTGFDLDPLSPEISAVVNFAVSWFTGEGTPEAYEFDLFTVLLHELTHGLGLLNFSDENGVSPGYNTYSVWDSLTETDLGSRLFVSRNRTPEFIGSPSDLIGGNLFFGGPAAAAVFGSKPPLFAPDPFLPGSSLGHFDTSIDIPGGFVMAPELADGVAIRQFAKFELAALSDLGYRVVLEGVPSVVEVSVEQAADQPDPADPANGNTVRFDVTFSAPVTGFGSAATDVILGGNAADVTYTLDPPPSEDFVAAYVLTATVNGAEATVIASVPAGVAANAQGHPNIASSSQDNRVAFGTEPDVEGGGEGEFVPPPGPPKGVLRGDADLNGVIDERDVTLVLQIAGGLAQAPSLFAADVDRDGAVTNEDAELIAAYDRAGGLVFEAPGALRVESGADRVTLFWEPVPHANLQGYALYRSDQGAPFERVGLSGGTMFTDTDVETVTYFYLATTLDLFDNEGMDSDTKEVLANTVRVWIPEVWAAAGTEVRVPINFGNLRGIVPKSMVFEVSFSPAAAALARMESTILSQELLFEDDLVGPGNLLIVSVDANAQIVEGEGRFFDVFLNVAADASEGCTDLILDRVLLLDDQDREISTIRVPGRLCIGTDGLLGDVDANRTIDVADAALALEISTTAVEADARQDVVADLNGDGRIDSADAVLILRAADGESINPSEAKSLEQRFTPGERTVTVAGATVNPNQLITVPVMLDSAQGVSGLDLVFAWSDRDFRFEGATAAGLLRGFDLSVTPGPGSVRVSLGNHTGLESVFATDVVELQFTVVGESTEENKPASSIRLNSAELKGTFGEAFRWFGSVTRKDGPITIVDRVTGDGELADGEGDGELADGEGESSGEGRGEIIGCAGGTVGTTSPAMGSDGLGKMLLYLCFALACLVAGHGRRKNAVSHRVRTN